jgi:hypothetical protein
MDWSTLIGMGPRLRLRRRLAQGQARHVRGAAVEAAEVPEAVVEAPVEAVEVPEVAAVAVGQRAETRLISRQAFKL